MSKDRIESIFDYMQNLPNEWDGYGTFEIESIIFDNARKFLVSIPENYVLQIKKIYPNFYGTISFEWGKRQFSDDKFFLEVEIDKNGITSVVSNLGVLIDDPDSEYCFKEKSEYIKTILKKNLNT